MNLFRIHQTRLFSSPGARTARASACLAAAIMVSGSLLMTGCGSSGRSVATSTATPAASRFAGVYTGPWTFSAGLVAGSTPTYGGTMSMTIGSNGSVAAVFTDTVGAGQGSFNAAGTVDESGTITYVSASPPLVGAPSFSGVAGINSAGGLAASGTLFYDYPGTGSWSSTGQAARS